MKIKSTPDRVIELDSNELAHAIASYIYARNVVVTGPRTIRVNVDGRPRLCRELSVEMFVDPAGQIVDNRYLEIEESTEELKERIAALEAKIHAARRTLKLRDE